MRSCAKTLTVNTIIVYSKSYLWDSTRFKYVLLLFTYKQPVQIQLWSQLRVYLKIPFPFSVFVFPRANVIFTWLFSAVFEMEALWKICASTAFFDFIYFMWIPLGSPRWTTDLIFENVHVVVGSWRILICCLSEVGRQRLHVEPEVLGIRVTLGRITGKTHTHAKLVTNDTEWGSWLFIYYSVCAAVKKELLGKNDIKQQVNHELGFILISQACAHKCRMRNTTTQSLVFV